MRSTYAAYRTLTECNAIRVADAWHAHPLLHQYILMGVTTLRVRIHGRARNRTPVLGNAKKNRDADAISVWPGH